MTGRAFADTNIAVYALDADTSKRAVALRVLRAGPVISVQVVNEFLSVMMAKGRLSREDAHRLARILMRRCPVEPLTRRTVEQAMALGERYRINHWDALIVASAMTAGCDILYTEDLQSGQTFGDELEIVNPFIASPPRRA